MAAAASGSPASIVSSTSNTSASVAAGGFGVSHGATTTSLTSPSKSSNTSPRSVAAQQTQLQSDQFLAFSAPPNSFSSGGAGGASNGMTSVVHAAAFQQSSNPFHAGNQSSMTSWGSTTAYTGVVIIVISICRDITCSSYCCTIELHFHSCCMTWK